MQRLSHRLPTFASSELRQLAVERCVRAGAALRRIRPADMARTILAVEVALTVTLAVVAGRMVWTVFEPPAWAASSGTAPAFAKPHRLATPAILTDVDPFHRAALTRNVPEAVARAPETMLNLQLFGIRAGAGDGLGGAIVATPDNVQGVFYVGQEIMPGVRLEQVLPDRVVIRRNGVSETLSFDREKLVQTAVPGPVPDIAPGEEPLRRLDVDVRSLATLLRFTQAERGLLLEGSADASVLQQTGLEPGDLLLAVNGTPANDMGALAALAASGALSLTLDIERKGQRKIHRLAIDRVQ